MSDVSTFLNESDFDSYEAFKFVDVGDKITGTITGTPRVVEVDDIGGTGKVQKLVIDVVQADGEIRCIWVKKGAMAKAISQAVKTAGATELKDGGSIGVAFTGLGTPSKPGFNPPKEWAAQYKPPTGGVDPSAIFGD